jgi:hypothetical protein
MLKAFQSRRSSAALLGGLAGVLAASACVVAGAVSLGVMTGLAPAMAPEPDPIPRRWQLAVEPGPLRIATVQTSSGPQSFYFLTYKVTNTSDQDLLFAPSFDLVTGEGEAKRSGRDVSAEVTREILARLESPFIQDQISIVGTLLQGEANAKEGVVIWPVNDTRLSEILIFAAGFSGETRGVEIKNAEGKLERVLLRKTLMMRFEAPGELREMAGKELPRVESRWVLR